MKKPKNIHLTEGTIKALSIQAIEAGTNFKNYVEDLLEGIAANRLRLSATAEKKKKTASGKLQSKK